MKQDGAGQRDGGGRRLYNKLTKQNKTGWTDRRRNGRTEQDRGKEQDRGTEQDEAGRSRTEGWSRMKQDGAGQRDGGGQRECTVYRES